MTATPSAATTTTIITGPAGLMTPHGTAGTIVHMAPRVQVAVSETPNAARARALAEELVKVRRELEKARKQNQKPPAMSSSAVNAYKDHTPSAELLRK